MGGAELGASETKSEPNVVPLCDILLVLLIIFMVVTPMIQRGANVRLPEAKNIANMPQPEEAITVDAGIDRISGELAIFIDNNRIDRLESLTSAIEDLMEEKQEDVKILLKADKELEYGKVVDVMNEIKKANVEILGLVTEQQTGTH
jgi:biopolymer transport protein TolR